MGSSRGGPAGAALLAAILAGAPSARGQVSLLNLNYESTALFAPALLHLRPLGNGDATFSLVGWTAAADWRRPAGAGADWLATLEATPRNAHRSDAVYRGGEPDPDSAFANSAWQAKAGIRRRHGGGWTGEYRLLVLREAVDAPDGSLRRALEDRWETPFAGVEILQAAERVEAADPLRNRWDGWKASARLQAYAGARAWWRAQAQAGWGRHRGGLFLRGGGTLFLGEDLDDVSRNLVGGGWELPGVHPLPGYRYGELRVEDGLLVWAGADWAAAGPLELGWRAGLLGRRGGRDGGQSLRVACRLPGSELALGWGLRELPGDRVLSRSVLTASWTMALWTPFGAD